MYHFAFKSGHSEKEEKTVHICAVKNPDKYQIKWFIKKEDVLKGMIPVGDIPWVQSVLEFEPKPDYYPYFMKDFLFRKVWESDTWPMISGIFIKPSDKPKRFQARITRGNYSGKKKPPYWCSEIIDFVDEWRYYVTDGQIVYAGWYDGKDIQHPKDPPELKVDIPTGWCGCIDMGMTSKGQFALVECAEPYSCGWYGTYEEGEIYTQWLIAGYEYLMRMKNGC